MKKLLSSSTGILLAIILIIFSFIGVLDLFKPGYYTSHDGEGHVIRLEEFKQAFDDGQIPVRWSKRLYYGYGYPFFNFNYPSIYYLGLIPMYLGASAAVAMKTVTGLSFVLSGLLMFLYLRRKVTDWPAFIGSFIYLFHPYRFSNIYVRGSVAEALTFVFPPLLLLVAENIADKKNKAILWGGLLLALIGISHNISALLLFALFFIYLSFLAVKDRNLAVIGRGFVSFILGLLMSAFFFIPALLEKKLTFLDQTIAKDYPDHFISLVQMIKGGWDFGSSVAGPNDGMSFNLGWTQLALGVMSLVILVLSFKNKKRKLTNLNLFLFSGFMFLLSVFMMLPASRFLWDTVPLLPFVQFSWRFTTLVVPVLAVMGAVGLNWLFKDKKIKTINKFLIILLIVAASLWQSKDQWFINQQLFVSKLDPIAISGTTTWADEQATKWLTPKPKQAPESRVEFENRTEEVVIKTWKTNQHEYQFNANQDQLIIEHTMYYPGWRVWVDGQEVEINYQDKQNPGLLVFEVKAGTHKVVSRFTETPLRKTVDLLSLAVFGVVVYLLIRSGKHRSIRRNST